MAKSLKNLVNDEPLGAEYKEYSRFLYDLTTTRYSQERVEDAVKRGYFVEALTDLNVEITNQLRFLLIKKIKGLNNIPLDATNERYNKILNLIKRMTTELTIQYSYIFQRIDNREYSILTELNTARNKFDHTFSQRKSLPESKIRGLVKRAIKIQYRLSEMVTQERLTGEITDLY